MTVTVLIVLLVYVVVAVSVLVRVYWAAREHHVWERLDTPTRIYLRCTICGRESPGWNLFGVPPGCERVGRRT